MVHHLNNRLGVLMAGAMLALLGPAAAQLPFALTPPPQPQEVDVSLVLAVDVSGSINNQELRIERDGTADAFLDPDVIKAIQNGALGKIAVTMLDFSSPQFDKVVIGWKIIQDTASAAAFAETVRNLPRTPGRRTSISSALELGSLLLKSSEKYTVASRRVIDVSGDGPNNDGNPMTVAHDKTLAQGIVVNGLPVMDDNANGYFPNLDKYYAACVAGGPGSFVIVVHSYKDFGAAMRRKLILEISQNEPQNRQADANSLKVSPLRVAAPLQVEPPSAPQLLRPGPNEFSNHCDIPNVGGFDRF